MADETKGTEAGAEQNPGQGCGYEAGKPDAPDQWRSKLRSRKEMLEYLRTAERYWFSDDWFGSERRKTKA